MQIVQKIYVECQEMFPDMKIKKGHFWFQNVKYIIENGTIHKYIPEPLTQITDDICETIGEKND